MNIIVLVKQTPDATEARVDPKTGNLIREGLEGIINPEDRHGIEAGVALREKMGGKVTIVSMGPPQAMEAVCEALAMGADHGALLTDRVFGGADTWATSTVLAAAIRKLGDYDLIIAGRQAIDGDTAQIGPQVAESLGIPQFTYVQRLEAYPDKLVAERSIEGACERIEANYPILITVVAELNTPRAPRVDLALDAALNRRPIDVWNAADLGLKAYDVGLAGSLTHVIKTFTPKEARRTEYMEGSPKEIAATLIQRLKDKEISLGE